MTFRRLSYIWLGVSVVELALAAFDFILGKFWLALVMAIMGIVLGVLGVVGVWSTRGPKA